MIFERGGIQETALESSHLLGHSPTNWKSDQSWDPGTQPDLHADGRDPST